MIERKAAELRKKQERYADLGRQLERSFGIERVLNSLGIPFEWPIKIVLIGVVGCQLDHRLNVGFVKGIKVNGVYHQFDKPMSRQEWEALKLGGEG